MPLNVGEKPIFILYTYIIDRHAGTPDKTKTKETMSLALQFVTLDIGSRIGWVSMKENLQVMDVEMICKISQYTPTVRTFLQVANMMQMLFNTTDETTATQQVSYMPIKCQSRSRSQKCAKVNGSHHGDKPLLKPTGIQFATISLPCPTTPEHRKLITALRRCL